jgi:hypothetical protein
MTKHTRSGKKNINIRTFRTELPNLYDDSNLDPYEFRLLAHYQRRGKCTEAVETTATICCMSVGQVSTKRKALTDKGFITCRQVGIRGRGFSYVIEVVDRWKENYSRYSKTPLEEVIARLEEQEREDKMGRR